MNKILIILMLSIFLTAGCVEENSAPLEENLKAEEVSDYFYNEETEQEEELILNTPEVYYYQDSISGKTSYSMGQGYDKVLYSYMVLHSYANEGTLVGIFLKNEGEDPLYGHDVCLKMPKSNTRECINSTVEIKKDEFKRSGIIKIENIGFESPDEKLEPYIGVKVKAKRADGGVNRYYSIRFPEVKHDVLEAENFTSFSQGGKNSFHWENMTVLVNEDFSEIRKKAIKIASERQGAFNYYQLFDLYEWVAGEVKYISDPHGLEYFASPKETIEARGGDCDDKSILLAAFIKAIGGSSRVYLTSDHAFNAVYVGNETGKEQAIQQVNEYYNGANIPVYFIQDDYGYWLVLDATWPSGTAYAGYLPAGAYPKGDSFGYDSEETLTYIDF